MPPRKSTRPRKAVLKDEPDQLAHDQIATPAASDHASDDDGFVPEPEFKEDLTLEVAESNSPAPEVVPRQKRKYTRRPPGSQPPAKKPKPAPRQKAPALSKYDPTILDWYPTSARQTQTRIYHGSLSGWIRTCFCEDFYGPDEGAISVAEDMVIRWRPYELLPSRLVDEDKCNHPSPWVSADFEHTQAAAARDWLDQVQDATDEAREKQRPERLAQAEADPYLMHPTADLKVLMGAPDFQKQDTLGHGRVIATTADGSPWSRDPAKSESGSESERPAGWMFDAGGIVLSMSWAPRAPLASQILALAVVPHTDQDYDTQEQLGYDRYDPPKDEKGLIQFWELQGERADNGVMYPSAKDQPRLIRSLCFDFGRPKKIEWCPAFAALEGHVGLLAVQCEGGQVHVFSVEDTDHSGPNNFEKLNRPLISLGHTDEADVTITCFAWAGVNRIATGHDDGTVTLWSLHPRRPIARKAVHPTHIIHLASGYPSQPHLVASTPVSGMPTLIDFLDPSNESASQTHHSTTPHPNLLQWSDHLQGFFTLATAPNPLNSTVGFTHSRCFSGTVRKALDGDAIPSALAVGLHHPFLLVALLDGTVWACNPINRVYAPRHYAPGWKVKVFEHQYVPAVRLGLNPTSDPNTDEPTTPPFRGVSRIAQGFNPTMNRGPKALLAMGQGSKLKHVRKPRLKQGKKDGETESVATAGNEEEDEGGLYADPSKIILQEPLTRTTDMAWNPNIDFSSWAGFAMASGLVKIMDLGVDH